MLKKQNLKKDIFSSNEILSITDKLDLNTGLKQQISTVITIGGENKLSLVPFICHMIQEQTIHTYHDIVEVFCSKLNATSKTQLFLYLRPDIKAYIDETIDTSDIKSDDYFISQEIQDSFVILHPKETIALLYYLGGKGGTYCKLTSGIKLSLLDESPEFMFNAPQLALETLTEGLKELNKDRSLTLFIRSSLQSLVAEAHIKLLNAQSELDIKDETTVAAIKWIKDNKPKHHRWKTFCKLRPQYAQ